MDNENSKSKQIIFALVGLAVGLALGIGGVFAYNNIYLKPVPQPVPKPIVKTIQPADRAQITDAVAATSIDKSGKAVNPTDTFNSKKDTAIYVVGALKNVPKGAKVEYVRYLNGKYLDSKVATVDQNGKKYFSFVWTTKTANNAHPDGVYTVKLYLNGDVSEAVTYVVQ